MLTNSQIEIAIPPEPLLQEQQLLPASTSELIGRLLGNREKLPGLAIALGISIDYLETLSSQSIQVGFAEQNFPVPTLFPGGPAEMLQSLQLSQELVNQLQTVGLQASMNLLLPIKWDSLPTNGYAACDYLALPKNEIDNKKVPLLGSKKQRDKFWMMPYCNIPITPEIIAQVKKQVEDSCASARKTIKLGVGQPLIPVSKLERRKIVENILSDIDTAFECSGGNYYDFVISFNQIFTQRLFELSLPSADVDANLQNFLIYAITDTAKFFTAMGKIGLDLDKEVLKTVGSNGKMKGINISVVDDTAIASNSELGELPLDKLLMKQDVFPKKELAYFAEMAGLLPQIYLDDNQIDYPPYLETQRMLSVLDLEPVIFPYRERVNLGFNDAVTLFDFYGYMLINQEA